MSQAEVVDCILLTQSRYLLAESPDWYVAQVLREQNLVIAALEKKGLRVTKKSWDDSQFDWSQATVVLVREVWDYFLRFGEFKSAIQKIASQSQLVNSLDQIRWNWDKHYMVDLEKKGIKIVPSHFVERSDNRPLVTIMEQNGWDDAVIKPTVSGAARLTFRINKQNAKETDTLLAKYRTLEDFMLQPFLQSVMSKGEISLVFFGRQFSHAVIKTAKEGDFRVQDDWGGTKKEYVPTIEEIAFALRTIEACDELPVYSRVDLMRDDNENLVLGELELIEPELWFRMSESAAPLLANELFRRYFSYV